MKLELIIANEDALRAFATLPLDDAQLVWNLSEALEEVGKAMTRYHEKRNELIKKYGTEKEGETGQYTVTDSVKMNDELFKLTSVDVKIKFPTVPLSKLAGVSISASDMIALKALKILTKK